MAPVVLLREGVFGRFGALNGPECVGVKALVEAAIALVVALGLAEWVGEMDRCAKNGRREPSVMMECDSSELR